MHTHLRFFGHSPNKEVTMKRIAIAAAVLAATALGSVAANAVEVDVGGGGVYVGPRHDYDNGWRWRHRETYGFGDRCRVIVRTHINRFGERVSVRRRICD
jgi:hypothetical protein